MDAKMNEYVSGWSVEGGLSLRVLFSLAFIG